MRGGLTPSGTDARVGVQVVYGWLPPGYRAVSATHYSGYILATVDHPNVAVGLTNDASNVTGVAKIEAGYLIGPPAWLSQGQATAGATTVNGHPAVVDTDSVSWQPEPDVEVSVDALDNGNLDQAAILHVADTVTFEPGVTTPPVGDLGPVISRVAAISEASSLASGSDMPARNPTVRPSGSSVSDDPVPGGLLTAPWPHDSLVGKGLFRLHERV